MSKLAIVGGRVLDPLNQVDLIANVYLAEGKIYKITPQKAEDFQPETVIDATGCVVSPGFVDINAALFDSGFCDEDYIANLEKAGRAGITHLSAYAFMPKHVLDSNEIAYFKELSSKAKGANAYFIGALTQGLKGQRLNELKRLQEAGCIGFSNGHQAIKSNLVLRRCYDYASMLGLKLFISLEDPDLSASGCMHEGEVSMRFGLRGIPSLSEHLAITRELLLIEETGISAHFCRFSSGKTVELMALAKNKVAVTGDAAIHQFFLTDEAIQLENGLYHVTPPFRTERDQEQLKMALNKDEIDAIVSDHIQLPKQVKEVPFQDSKPGIASWPLLLPLLLQLVREKTLTINQAIALITHQPARILGIEAGSLCQNPLANITIFDPNKFWYLSNEDLNYFGANNPFQTWRLTGKVMYTIINGKVVYQHTPSRE
jgi:dihydroorotase